MHCFHPPYLFLSLTWGQLSRIDSRMMLLAQVPTIGMLMIDAFVYLFSRLMSQMDIGALLQIRHFSWSSFLLAVSLAASWQIAFGPYVADYSRYLPSKNPR